jgi:two-component system, cell cycle sensor histidine kinase DivJ
MTALPARLASAWVPGMADAGLDQKQNVLRLAALSLIALPVVPGILSIAFSPAVAFPAGVGGVVAITLAGAAFFSRPLPETGLDETSVETGALPDYGAFYALMPGLVTVHNERGHVVTVSGRDRETLGQKLRPLEGQSFIDQIHVSDRILFLQAIDRLRQGENAATVNIRFEALCESTTGQFLHRRLYLSALRKEEGALSGFFVQMMDNAEEEALKNELANRAAETISANEAKSRFLAAVSHELRTPLNAVLGFSEILLGEYFGKLENDRQREYVGLINQSGVHLLGVVNTMLDMSKIEAGHYELICEHFRVAEVAEACDGMLSLQAKNKGVTLTSRVSRDAGEVYADRRAIQQVMINLIGNAIKFTNAGGVVSVDVENSGPAFTITVSDTGIGIPADKIDLLGKPFMQVQNEHSRKYEGTGLGLSLVKGLVALHGGKFSVASVLGEGTVMTVVIPNDGARLTAEDEETDTSRMTEFPPRLKSATDTKKKNEEVSHEHAKAQTA